MDGGPQPDTADPKERRRKAFNLPARTPVKQPSASPVSATIRDVFAEYSGGAARDMTAGHRGRETNRPWARAQPLEQSYSEALRDIYALTPGGQRPERTRSPSQDVSARWAVSSRLHAAERAADNEREALYRQRERERSMRESSLGPGEFLAAGKEERRRAGGGSSPISNAHVTPVSYVHGVLREAMGEYSSSGVHKPPTPRAPNSQTSVSFSLPSGAGHVGYFHSESSGRDVSTASQGSALLYTTLNGDARRVSRSLDELKRANLSLTTVCVCVCVCVCV